MALPRPLKLGLAAFLGIALAIAAFSNALGNVVARTNPSLTRYQLGANPAIVLRDVNFATLPASSREERAMISAQARQTLARQALAPMAFTVLGFVADADGRRDIALTLLADAHALSRRNIMTELYLLEWAVARDAVPEVLEQYDIVLRQELEFRGVAFPILDAALSDPTIAEAFRPYLAKNTPWMRDFLGITAATSPSPQVIAGVLLRTNTVQRAMDLGLELPTLFRRLTETGHVDMVRAIYLASRKGPASLLASVQLDDAGVDPAIAPVAWRLADTADLVALTSLDEKGAPVLNIEASNENAQISADKLLFLRPGAYRFAFVAKRAGGSRGVGRWLALCLSSGAPRILGATANVLGNPGSSTLNFAVTPDCRAVQLAFEAHDDSGEDGVEIDLSGLSLSARGTPPRPN